MTLSRARPRHKQTRPHLHPSRRIGRWAVLAPPKCPAWRCSTLCEPGAFVYAGGVLKEPKDGREVHLLLLQTFRTSFACGAHKSAGIWIAFLYRCPDVPVSIGSELLRLVRSSFFESLRWPPWAAISAPCAWYFSRAPEKRIAWRSQIIGDPTGCKRMEVHGSA
jgi:hypothetical protein